ncbi:protein of unknown function [Latilactobacillus sakei]|nr:protein of unknown function [Latilactobacillus sakei]
MLGQEHIVYIAVANELTSYFLKLKIDILSSYNYCYNIYSNSDYNPRTLFLIFPGYPLKYNIYDILILKNHKNNGP